MPRVLVTLLLLLVAVLPPSVQAAAGHKTHVKPLPYGTWVRYVQHHVTWPDGRVDDRSGWAISFPVRVINKSMVVPQIRHTPAKRAPKRAATARRVSAPRGRYTVAMLVTWYQATGARMANGVYPSIGWAACSYDLALGTRIFVAGIGSFTCGDREGYDPYHRHIDVFGIPCGATWRLVTVY